MPRLPSAFPSCASTLAVLLSILVAGLCACSGEGRDRAETIVEAGAPPTPEEAWRRMGPEAFGGEGAVAALGDEVVERLFQVFPSRATSAGLYRHDHRLEDWSEETLDDWFTFADEVLARLPGAVEEDCGDRDAPRCGAAEIDADLLRREIELHLLDWRELERPTVEAGAWSGLVGSSTVYLLVRDDRPAAERARHVVERLRQVPRFLATGRERLADGDRSRMTELDLQGAASRARSLAGFYREGLEEAFGGLPGDLRVDLEESAAGAADALSEFADFTGSLLEEADGSPILGPELYARRFALYTGLAHTPDEVLAWAEESLGKQLAEADEHALDLWDRLFEEEPPPTARERVRRLFLRLGDDHAETVEEFVEDYRTLVVEAERFVHENDVVTTPDPLTLITDRSPPYFSGAAVGGVYSTGPYAPQAPTLLYLPTPPEGFDAEQTREFFRDFNHHFNVMITPHELMPGHYLQLKWAALHPSRIRALFGDPVTIEGWGTFVERLMLDLGWGDDLARAAHLKKRMENTARTIVDIRVHTRGMSADEVERFVVEEALQEEQFARNMRRRTLTTSPQLVTYYLGSREIERAWKEFRSRRPEAPVRAFTDGVLATGPVPVDDLVRLLVEPLGD